MTSRTLRACGITMALLVPASGLAVITTAPTGATTHTLVITSGGITVTCTNSGTSTGGGPDSFTTCTTTPNGLTARVTFTATTEQEATVVVTSSGSTVCTVSVTLTRPVLGTPTTTYAMGSYTITHVTVQAPTTCGGLTTGAAVIVDRKMVHELIVKTTATYLLWCWRHPAANTYKICQTTALSRTTIGIAKFTTATKKFFFTFPGGHRIKVTLTAAVARPSTTAVRKITNVTTRAPANWLTVLIRVNATLKFTRR